MILTTVPAAPGLPVPSLNHEVIVDLFRTRPLLAAELLVLAGIIPAGAQERGRLAESTMSAVVPTEYSADAVVELTGAFAIRVVLEVQLAALASKLRVWPVYLGTLFARHGGPVALLVVCLDPVTARYYRKPIVLGPGSVIRPIVFGPSRIPKVTDPVVAAARPELAMLSVMAHGRSRGGYRVGRAALSAFTSVDGGHARLYVDLVLNAVTAAVRARLEAEMVRGWEPSETLLRIEAAWRKKADEQAEARGEVAGRRALLTRMLTQRFGPLSNDTQARLVAAQVEDLDRWADRILVADSIDEVFESRSR